MPKYSKVRRWRIDHALKMTAKRHTNQLTPEDQTCVLATSPTNENNEQEQATPTTGQLQIVEDVMPEAMKTMNDTTNSDNDEEELQISYEQEGSPIQNEVGRRIIAVSFFIKKLKEISSHGPLGCGINEIVLISETRSGLQSKFTFKCLMCNINFVVESDNCEDNYAPINTCAVAGTIAIGNGQSQLEEFLSAINLPVINVKLYKKCHDLISHQWVNVLSDSVKQAAATERRLAFEQNRVNKDGIPIIDVIVDGCWSKRSYKKNYNALSGAAAIIGKLTGDVLYLGIKNKYCSICSQVEKGNIDIKEHRCFKNYDGPSTNMESEILVEGFKNSIATHNLIYGRMISDGDSSTYSKILQARPYKDVTVEKIECRNHILRNMCNKIINLSTDTKYILTFRKLITQKRVLILRSTLCKCIKKHKVGSDVKYLFDDILLSHYHAFGNHIKCRPHFCNKIGTNEEVPQNFYQSALWQKICFILQNVAGHARSLIHDVDSNAVEQFHNIVAKFVGGKRINFSKRNSYQTRCQAAAVSFNEKKTVSLLYKSFNGGDSPQGKIKRLETKRLKKNIKTKRLVKRKSRFIVKKANQDRNYGEDCLKPDMPAAEFEALKQIFLKDLTKSQDERKAIERKTILQSESGEWLELRRSLLTASNFGKTIKRRTDTSCQNFVRDLLYKSNIDHVSSIKHGRDNEKVAIQQLEEQEGIKLEPCGLFIDENLPFLGATPDGLCAEDTILEIKCPITAHKLGIDEAIKKKKVTFWQMKKNELVINKNHNWYYQIQGQLHITRKPKCLFAVWSNKDTRLKTEVIERDDQFWNQNMESKLKSFYIDCILPELVDPRHPRGLPIRNPPYIEDAIRKKQKIIIEKARGKENIKPLQVSTEDRSIDAVSVEMEQSFNVSDKMMSTGSIENEIKHDEVEMEQMPTCSRYLDFTEM